MKWSLPDAKKRFSEFVRRACLEGTQIIMVRRARAAIVPSADDDDALNAARPTIIDDLWAGPAWDDAFADSVTWRSKTPGRTVAF